MTDSADLRPGIADGAATEVEAQARIARAVSRARLGLVWESVWPLFAPFLGLAALFAAVSWLGVWRLVSDPARLAILAAFAAALVFFLARALRFRPPSRAAAFSRVEHATGVEHRPATSLSDSIANGGDPATEALWLAHRRRLLAAMERLRSGFPAPRLAARDPLALRFLVALLFVVGFVVAGDEHGERLAEAFRGGEPPAATVARIDAWVTPPAYTGRPPIFLTGDAAKPNGTEYSVPTGSVVTVRTGGAHDLAVTETTPAGATPIAPTAPTATAASADGSVPPLEHQAKLTAATAIAVQKGGHDVLAWRFQVVPDNPPSIALAGDPRVAESGALHLTYTLSDDYGVISAYGEFAPLSGTSGGAARPLYKAPQLALSLPQLRTRDGTGDTTRDLTSHPWAGARVKLTLVARDEAGQEGRSAPVELTLPTRVFTNPIAKAIVEQRARLALDANARPVVADALDAITMVPDRLPSMATYLTIRSAYHRLLDARSDDDLRGVVDYLWTIALGLENGDMSLAADQLRAAQDALNQALQNNASDDEIAKLTQQLRDALQKFLQALAQQAQQSPMAQLPPNANVQTLTEQQLERMLDQIQNLAQTGARDAARQLLSQLQNMLENLQAGMPQPGDQGQQQAMQQLNQLGDMIRRQEQLMNQTFGAERSTNPDGSPMTNEQFQQMLKDLQSQQQALNDEFNKLMQEMQGQGTGNGKLGQAGEAMGRAEQALGAGRAGSAVNEQSSALDALRQGAQSLAQQLANGQGNGPGNGMPGQGTRGFTNNSPGTDPLGRPQRSTGADLGSTVKVPDEIDTQRAREILDAIRQRLGASGLPALERDYLERLLEPF
ncbi:MAG TPA: TIGR02302 family protein [Bauldia sp.]|nr:TIGR02302 family protein [Bauldia sp.]